MKRRSKRIEELNKKRRKGREEGKVITVEDEEFVTRDGLLDLINVELLLHIICVGNLKNKDIISLMCTCKRYNDTINLHRDYLRNRDYLKASIAYPLKGAFQEIKEVILPNATAIGHWISTDVDYKNNLMLCKYNMYSAHRKNVRVLAIMLDKMLINWTYDICADRITKCSLTTSSVGVLLMNTYSDKITVLDLKEGTPIEKYKHWTLPFKLDILDHLCQMEGYLFAVHRVLTNEHYGFYLSGEKNLCGERIHLPKDYAISPFAKVTKYALLDHPTILRSWKIIKMPYADGDYSVDINQASTVRICGEKAYANDDDDNLIVYDLAKTFKEKSLIAKSYPMPMKGYAFYKCTDDGRLCVFGTCFESYIWFDTVEERWIGPVSRQQHVDVSCVNTYNGKKYVWNTEDTKITKFEPNGVYLSGDVANLHQFDVLTVYKDNIYLYRYQ